MSCRNALAALAVFAAALSAGLPAAADRGIKNTKHNLSVQGPGPLRAFGERRICVFCHTPHSGSAAAPLWNRRDSGRTYIKYWSPTLDAYGRDAAPPIDGTSRLCLSCHDGTVALGDVLQSGLGRGLGRGRAPIRMRPGAERVNQGRFFGTDLSGSHPISFRVTSELIQRNNARDLPLKSLASIRASQLLDANDKVQCTSCHNPHHDRNSGDSGVPFYRSPTWQGVCLACHEQ